MLKALPKSFADDLIDNDEKGSSFLEKENATNFKILIKIKMSKIGTLLLNQT